MVARMTDRLVSDGIMRQGLESVIGGNGDDLIYGNTGGDLLLGEAGIDQLFGGQDDDCGGPDCLNRFSASISGASARVRPPRGGAAG